LYFLGFVVLGAVASFLVFKLAGFDESVSVPSLAGRSLSEAGDILAESGLSLEIGGEDYDEEIPRGHIISQDIARDSEVKKGSGIMVIVSRGKEVYSVPYFEGMDLKDVRLTLRKLNMETGKITKVHSDTVEKGRVITQRPLPGHFSDNKVNLVVSLGPYDVFYKCPSFIDMTLSEAKGLADQLGIRLIKRESGRVIIFQKPEAGASVKKGDSVEITLGRGSGFWF
ncbi:MAG TPA: PASTA domain-containing protein, partial [Nitrospirae bacterium]|nr:PASTA domain-containing protein [Nitrospirota bacterium]